MPLHRIRDLSDPRVGDYQDVAKPRHLLARGLFVAEGRLVVRTLLGRSSFRTRSVLVTEAALRSLMDVLEPRLADLPVFVCGLDVLEGVVGFNIHRGCLALGERDADARARGRVRVADTARRVLALEGVGNPDNMGGVFRNAAAFGVEGILIGPGSCDPLYRKSIRVSIGNTLLVPFLETSDWPGALIRLRDRGLTIVALTPKRDAIDIDRWLETIAPADGLVLLVGSEGEGLSSGAESAAGFRVRIPMARGVDSLNLATATGIALHRLLGREWTSTSIE
jgi:tRNA G18 (ribose-2'-O)-methylase SpoU